MKVGSVTVSIKEASDGNTSGSWWSPYSFNYDIVETLLTENNEYVALNFSSGNMCICHAEWMSLNGNETKNLILSINGNSYRISIVMHTDNYQTTNEERSYQRKNTMEYIDIQ